MHVIKKKALKRRQAELEQAMKRACTLAGLRVAMFKLGFARLEDADIEATFAALEPIDQSAVQTLGRLLQEEADRKFEHDTRDQLEKIWAMAEEH